MNRTTRWSLECEQKMNIPDAASYRTLLDALEDRLLEDDIEDFGYLVELVNDLYKRAIDSETANYGGCLSQGSEAAEAIESQN